MKRIVSLLAVFALLVTLLPSALAGEINPKEKRGIKLQNVGLNDVVDGVSPTTGLDLADYDVVSGYIGLAVNGRYQPMLVQIDNSEGGVGEIAPWGATYADIVYETPLHANGATRISFLFSDVVPTSVGPVRSARVGHAWLREEWDAGFLYYGGQTRKGSNINDVFKITGASKKDVLFSGIVGEGKPWKEYYTRRAGVPAPHNVDANVAAMLDLIPASLVPPNHAYRFTDDLPEGEPASVIKVSWAHDGYGSELWYDADSNLYFRYMVDKETGLIPYEDRDTQEQIAFANVIVQFTDVKFNGSSAAPVTRHIGEGNADFFMGGVHIAGYWKREGSEKTGDASARTVFYAPDGSEMPMQRGRTLIIIFPNEPYSKKMTSMGVSYEE